MTVISANSGSFLGALRKSSRSLSHLLMSSCNICYIEITTHVVYTRVEELGKMVTASYHIQLWSIETCKIVTAKYISHVVLRLFCIKEVYM